VGLRRTAVLNIRLHARGDAAVRDIRIEGID
jgi:hypothetical protein